MLQSSAGQRDGRGRAVGEVDGRHGWRVGESIALELDVALSFACQVLPPRGKGEAFESLWSLVSAEDRAEYVELQGEARAFRPTLEVLAVLAGVVGEADYAKASLAMRDLDASAALASMGSLAAPTGGGGLPKVAEALLPAYSRFVEKAYVKAGMERESVSGAIEEAQRAMARAIPILRGGPLHGRFWLWLDRFYYGGYASWREARKPALAKARETAVLALGGPESMASVPPLAWLPEENPLRRRPELAAAVKGGLSVFFWIEPFGIADLWLLEPGRVFVSVAAAGALFEAFKANLENVALRAAALGDPTRLTILRMIRQVGMTNTDMAGWLHLSRPTVSVHAKVLREAGLIRSRQEGRTMRHEIVPGELARLFRDLADLLDLDIRPASASAGRLDEEASLSAPATSTDKKD
jgi:ArsR family transcriptional regulator